MTKATLKIQRVPVLDAETAVADRAQGISNHSRQ